MKILFVNTFYYPHIGGGAEISLQYLVEGLHKLGHEVLVLATGQKESGLQVEYINSVKVYRAGIKNIYWHYSSNRPGKVKKLLWHINDRYNGSMQGYLEEVLADERPDVVSCHNITGWSTAVWDTIKRFKTPVVQVLHDLYLLCANSNMNKGGRDCPRQCKSCALLRAGFKERSKQVDAVVAISRYMMTRFDGEGYFEEVSKQVVYNYRQALDIKPYKEKDTHKFRFGFIGTLSEAKGVQWLIQAFMACHIDAELLIAGQGQDSYVSHLKSLAQCENIKFLGYVDRVDFYSKIDVLIVPSLWQEPLGMVAIEACAEGVPVIATKKGGLVEIIKHEWNGLLLDPLVPDSLGEAMIRLYSDKQLLISLKESCKTSVKLFLDKKRYLNEYLKVYEELLQ